MAGTFIVLATACRQENKLAQEYNATMQEALEAHDAVMPKMGTLGELIEQLQQKSAADTLHAQAYKKATSDLQEAHQLMMDWMKDFSEAFPNALSKETLSQEAYQEKLPSLKEQAQKAQVMEESINNSIQNAQQLLNE